MAVSAGDRLKILAREWNDLLALLRWWKRTGVVNGYGRGPAGKNQFGTQQVWVKNTTGTNLNAFEVLQISDLMIDILATPSEKYNTLSFDGIAPVFTLPMGRYCVLQEPAKSQQGSQPGGIARAVLSGETLVKLNIVHTADWACDLVAGTTSYLQTGPVGTSRILLKHTGTGSTNKFGVVRLGDAVDMFFGKPNATIASGASGTVNIWKPDFTGSALGPTVSGYNHSADSLLSTDKVHGVLVDGVVVLGKLC